MYYSRKRPRTKIIVFLLSSHIFLTACSPIRSEFYREETHHQYQQAMEAYSNQNYDKADVCFQQTISLDPTYTQARVGLANIALIQEKYDEAIALYNQAIKEKPALVEKLQPLLQAAQVRQSRQPLIDSGATLQQIFRLLEARDSDKIEKIIEEDVPLMLLSRDYLSLQLDELEKMTRLAAAEAKKDAGTPRYRLFLAYYLYGTKQSPDLTAGIIKHVAPHLNQSDQQEAFAVLGKLFTELSKENDAVTAYLQAVEAGVSMDDIAPELAEIYGVPVVQIISENQGNNRGALRPDSAQDTILSTSFQKKHTFANTDSDFNNEIKIKLSEQNRTLHGSMSE